jgi:hypothetical protein
VPQGRGPTAAARRFANGQNFREVGLHQCPSERKGEGVPVRCLHVPSHVPSHPQTAAKVRGFSLTASGFTAETDWLLEGSGFEPSVPPKALGVVVLSMVVPDFPLGGNRAEATGASLRKLGRVARYRRFESGFLKQQVSTRYSWIRILRGRASCGASFCLGQITPQRRYDFAGPHPEFGSADRALHASSYPSSSRPVSCDLFCP